MHARYVAGFLFSDDLQRVALIRKLKPQWQCGRLNGIGGKIEPAEEPASAMAREFREETGVITPVGIWQPFAFIQQYESLFFRATSGLVDSVASAEEEEVGVYGTLDLPANVLFNLRWLIPLAMDQALSPKLGIRVL